MDLARPEPSAAGLPRPSVTVPARIVRGGASLAASRAVPEETAVSFSYNRIGHAVMMATPADLHDFAIGFSLTEGIIGHPGEVEDLDIVPAHNGIELRMWLAGDLGAKLADRRRHMAGPTGCGLCGLETLDQATRVPPQVSGTLAVPPEAVLRAVAAVRPAQALNQATRATHAAAFVMADAGGNAGLVVREDVGRHNALDKLAGALAIQGQPAGDGILVLTSRVSVELVQKAAAMGVLVLAAMSAPTALALRTADRAGMTVIGIARDDGFEVFTHPHRVQ